MEKGLGGESSDKLDASREDIVRERETCGLTSEKSYEARSQSDTEDTKVFGFEQKFAIDKNDRLALILLLLHEARHT